MENLPKRVIGLISMNGKTKNQLRKEIAAAFRKDKRQEEKKKKMENSFGPSKGWELPATLEEFEKKIREQSEDETGDKEQEEDTETFEVRFVPNIPPKETMNLVGLNELLKGRRWEEMTKEEQLEVGQKIADLISNKL